MAITGKQLAEMSLGELLALLPKSNTHCPKCGNKFNELQYTISGEAVCSDCWYGEIGKLIDEHPIGYPGAVGARGCGNID